VGLKLPEENSHRRGDKAGSNCANINFKRI
jgi:hypothetical protein